MGNLSFMPCYKLEEIWSLLRALFSISIPSSPPPLLFFKNTSFLFQVLIICARFEFNQEVKNAQQNNKNVIIVENITPNNNKKIKNEKSFRNKIEIIFNKFAKIYVKIVSNIWASIFICFVWLAVLLVCIKVNFFKLFTLKVL